MIVFVTGATAGFGLAIAHRFAADGARVVAAGRRRDRLDALAAELGPDRAHALPLDVTERGAVEAAVAALPDAFAAVDVLVNNAGLARGLEPAQSADLDDWDAMVDTNVKGLMYVTRAVLPGMVARNAGHVVNIGSTAGEWPYPGGNVYGATKAFVRQFSLNLRADLFGTRVRVTDIEPAGIYQGAEALTPDDIADTVHWVATRPARVNINTLQVMPVSQSFGPLRIHRG
jgi:3-hydroxy acid dehydrogenase / malonic semialdehyde reductase